MPHVELAQGRIDYREVGRGHPVVFVHGFLTGGDVWQDVATRLAPAGFRCLMPTWPLGAHETPLAPGADASPRGQAAVVAAFLEALDLRDVLLVGNDTGGAVAQLVATRHPERLAGLVLTNCDMFDNFPPAAFKPLLAIARVPGGLRALLAPLRFAGWRRSRFGFGLLTERDIDHLTRAWVRPHRESRGVFEDIRRLALAIDPAITRTAAEELRAFKRPVLLAWATDDPLFPVAHARRLAGMLPDAQLRELPGRAFSMVDRPEELARHIGDWARAAVGVPAPEARDVPVS